MDIKIIIFSIAGFLFVAGIALVVINAMRKKGKWGIHLNPMVCPKCNADVPTIRKPSSAKEAAWGGWTCSNCGCKMDKWGHEIT